MDILKSKEPALGAISQSGAQSGLSYEQALQIILLHRHDGTPAGGPRLFGPFFFKDTANGKMYRLDSTNGALVLTQA